MNYMTFGIENGIIQIGCVFAIVIIFCMIIVGLGIGCIISFYPQNKDTGNKMAELRKQLDEDMAIYNRRVKEINEAFDIACKRKVV